MDNTPSFINSTTISGFIGFMAFLVLSFVGIMVILNRGKSGDFRGAANSLGVALIGSVILALAGGMLFMSLGSGILDALFNVG
jgi:hypothetical protein